MRKLLIILSFFTLSLSGQTGLGNFNNGLWTFQGGAVSFTPPVYNDSALVLFDRFSQAPNTDLKESISQWYDTIQYYNIDDSLDSRYVFALHNSTDALLDWFRPTSATLVNSPTFTRYKGYTTNGSTSYIKSNYNPGTDAVNYKLNSNLLSFYSRTNNFDVGEWPIGISDGVQNHAFRFSATQYLMYNNGTALWILDNGGSVSGSNIMYRTDNVVKFNKNGVLNSSSLALLSITDQADGIYIGARNNNGAAANYSPNQFAITNIGGGISDLQAQKLYEADERYMDAFGNGQPLLASVLNDLIINKNLIGGGDLLITQNIIIDEPIKMLSNVNLIGQNDTILLPNNSDTNIFRAEDINNFSVSGFIIDGNFANQNVASDAIYLSSVNGVLLSDLIINNASRNGISITSDGVNRNTFVKIINTTISSALMNSVFIKNTDSLIFTGNNISGHSAKGLSIQNGGDFGVISGNYFTSSETNFFSIEAYTPSDPLTNYTISDNIMNSDYSGISIFCDSCLVTNNDLNGTTGTTRDGIEFFGNNSTISYNTILNGTIGITQLSIFSSANDSIIGNTIGNTGTSSAIKIGSAIDGMIADNFFIEGNNITTQSYGGNNHGIDIGYSAGYALIQNISAINNTVTGDTYPPYFNSCIRIQGYFGSFNVLVDNNQTSNTYFGIIAPTSDSTNILSITNNTTTNHFDADKSINTTLGNGVYFKSGNTIL